LVEAIPTETADAQIMLTISTSTGVAIQLLTVTSNAGTFTFQPNEAVNVPLAAGQLNVLSVTALIAGTTIDGCEYAPYTVTASTDRNGTALQIQQTTANVPPPTETLTIPPTETPTETPTDAPTETPTNTVEAATATICAPQQQATLIVEPIPQSTFDGTIQFTVSTSTGAAYESLTVSSEAGSTSFQPGQPIVVQLVPNAANNFVITANFPATNVNGCDYPAYQATINTDRNGAPLQIVQQAPPTPTEAPTNTPEPTVCAPQQQATLIVEPISATTTEQAIQLSVSTSTGENYEVLTVNSNAGQANFQPGEPIVVQLVPGTVNQFTLTANFPATNVNGCDYPAYQATVNTDRNGAPLQIEQQAPVAVVPTDVPPQQPEIIDLSTVPLVSNIDNGGIRNHINDIFNRGKQSGRVKEDFSVIGEDTLQFAEAIAGPAVNFESAPDLQAIAQYFAAGFPSIEQRLDQCNTNSLQLFDCASTINAAVTFIDIGNAYRLTGQPPEQLRADLDALVTQLDQQGIIPVLVTIPGPTNDNAVIQYNSVIAAIARDRQLPMLNLYRLGVDNPNFLNGDRLSAAPDNQTAADFTGAGMQFGENNANIGILRMLKEIKEKVIDVNP
jgi:hypothetical protein